MKILLDTHLLLWAGVFGSAIENGALSAEANELYFSPAGIWEVAIKNALGKPTFRV